MTPQEALQLIDNALAMRTSATRQEHAQFIEAVQTLNAAINEKVEE